MATQATSLPAAESTAPVYPPPRQGWTAVTVLLLLYVVSSPDRHIISPFGDHIKADFGLSDMQRV